ILGAEHVTSSTLMRESASEGGPLIRFPLKPGTSSLASGEQSPGCDAGACGPPSRHCVFGRLNRSSLDDLASWLRLEDRWLFRERIDTPTRLRGGLLYDDELGESWHHERAGLLEFLVANFGYRLDDALDSPCARSRSDVPRRFAE